jgi:hypothetical protein
VHGENTTGHRAPTEPVVWLTRDSDWWSDIVDLDSFRVRIEIAIPRTDARLVACRKIPELYPDWYHRDYCYYGIIPPSMFRWFSVMEA